MEGAGAGGVVVGAAGVCAAAAPTASTRLRTVAIITRVIFGCTFDWER
jgi:hypothetical protein